MVKNALKTRWPPSHVTERFVMIDFFVQQVNAHLHVKFQVSKSVLKFFPMLNFQICNGCISETEVDIRKRISIVQGSAQRLSVLKISCK